MARAREATKRRSPPPHGALEGGAIFTLLKSVIGVSSVLEPTHRKMLSVVVGVTRIYASKKIFDFLFVLPADF
eukprot:scaffold23256_cov55-Phaeocystis_antarctica.AAC.1